MRTIWLQPLTIGPLMMLERQKTGQRKAEQQIQKTVLQMRKIAPKTRRTWPKTRMIVSRTLKTEPGTTGP